VLYTSKLARHYSIGSPRLFKQIEKNSCSGSKKDGIDIIAEDTKTALASEVIQWGKNVRWLAPPLTLDNTKPMNDP